ncbi:hypothetical protein TRVA0_004S04170 [Trichomonascus vanleenenianus]|uniref:SUMO-targeted ubiquitin ligase complex subunit SLX8 n=1 Tax=Trichomonascus vanleenenianus TaxID=2268995 RepID=UPI003ECAA8DD
MPANARVLYARNTPPPPVEELQQQNFSDISSSDGEAPEPQNPEEAPVSLTQLAEADDDDESYDESYNPSYNSYQSDDDDVFPTPLEELLASLLEQQRGRDDRELDEALDSAMDEFDSAASPEVVTIESSEEEDDDDDEDDDEVIEVSSNPKRKRVVVEDMTEENLKASQPEGLRERKRLNTFNCPVCMDEAEKIVVTPCGHLYCSDCVFRALSSTSHATESKGECSICRRGVMYKNLTYLELKCG